MFLTKRRSIANSGVADRVIHGSPKGNWAVDVDQSCTILNPRSPSCTNLFQMLMLSLERIGLKGNDDHIKHRTSGKQQIEIRKDALKRGLLHSNGTPILKGRASWPEDVVELFNMPTFVTFVAFWDVTSSLSKVECVSSLLLRNVHLYIDILHWYRWTPSNCFELVPLGS